MIITKLVFKYFAYFVIPLHYKDIEKLKIGIVKTLTFGKKIIMPENAEEQ